MSTQTVTQPSPVTATQTTEVASEQPVAQPTTVTTETKQKKGKITDSIVNALKELPEGQLMTISELCEKLSHVKPQTLQATLSNMVKANRVEKVVTKKRQPGYKAVSK